MPAYGRTDDFTKQIHGKLQQKNHRIQYLSPTKHHELHVFSSTEYIEIKGFSPAMAFFVLLARIARAGVIAAYFGGAAGVGA